MKIVDELRSLLDDVREHGVVQLADNATWEWQRRMQHAWIDTVVWVTKRICNGKDRSIAHKLHVLAGLYQTRPQEGWQAPADWECWDHEAESIATQERIQDEGN